MKSPPRSLARECLLGGEIGEIGWCNGLRVLCEL